MTFHFDSLAHGLILWKNMVLLIIQPQLYNC